MTAESECVLGMVLSARRNTVDTTFLPAAAQVALLKVQAHFGCASAPAPDLASVLADHDLAKHDPVLLQEELSLATIVALSAANYKDLPIPMGTHKQLMKVFAPGAAALAAAQEGQKLEQAAVKQQRAAASAAVGEAAELARARAEAMLMTAAAAVAEKGRDINAAVAAEAAKAVAVGAVTAVRVTAEATEVTAIAANEQASTVLVAEQTAFTSLVAAAKASEAHFIQKATTVTKVKAQLAAAATAAAATAGPGENLVSMLESFGLAKYSTIFMVQELTLASMADLSVDDYNLKELSIPMGLCVQLLLAHFAPGHGPA